MRSCKTVFTICMQNIRKWSKDYRIWCVAILLLTITQIYVDDIRDIADYLNAKVSVWIFPFMYSQYYTKLIFIMPVILLFCNAPFIDDNQVYVYVRAGKRKWIAGQLLYIIIASALYYLYLIIISVLSLSLHGTFDADWGNVLYTIAESGIASHRGRYFVNVSSMILDYFTPMQAIWFTFLVSWSHAVLIGFIIFACNYLTKLKYLGLSISSIIIIFSMFLEHHGYPGLMNFSPSSWVTLDRIDIGGRTTNPSFLYCMLFYWISIFIITLIIYLFSSKKSFDFRR